MSRARIDIWGNELTKDIQLKICYRKLLINYVSNLAIKLSFYWGSWFVIEKWSAEVKCELKENYVCMYVYVCSFVCIKKFFYFLFLTFCRLFNVPANLPFFLQRMSCFLSVYCTVLNPKWFNTKIERIKKLKTVVCSLWLRAITSHCIFVTLHKDTKVIY